MERHSVDADPFWTSRTPKRVCLRHWKRHRIRLSVIFVDLSVLTDSRQLMAALFVARVTDDTLAIVDDDLHRLYWMAGGIISDPSDNDQMWAFSRFFGEYHRDMRNLLPPDPPLNDPAGTIVLLERCIDQGWVTVVMNQWGDARLLERLFSLPRSALIGF